ncbi:MAG TPA: ribonuclease P protein component [bacterium]|nr:ribonuclease P protein component [bacterium]
MSSSDDVAASTVRWVVRSSLGGPDVRTVYRKGTRHITAVATVYVLRGERQGLRVAVVAGRRLGSAVSRNRIRRRLGEAFRHIEKDLRSGADIVIVARSGAETAPFESVISHLSEAFVDARMMRDNVD